MRAPGGSCARQYKFCYIFISLHVMKKGDDDGGGGDVMIREN